jgi:hypothetical protein
MSRLAHPASRLVFTVGYNISADGQEAFIWDVVSRPKE